jgi:acyl-CoA-binding protein
MPSQKILRTLFDYKAITGKLIWKQAPKHNSQVLGEEAGWLRKDGYRAVKVGGKELLSHRAVWIWNYGCIPTGKEIDHINHQVSDNRLLNLRLVTHDGNCRNRRLRSDNESGHVGVYYSKRKLKWEAYANLRGKRRCLGHFSTIKEAIEARRSTAGYHPNHGKKEATTKSVA